MAELYDRRASLVVGDYDFSDLDFAFKVRKNLKQEPNTAEVSIYNLSPSSRSALAGQKNIPVRLKAGYKGSTAQLFFGELRSALTKRDGADWVTELSTGDAESARKARLAVTVGAKTTPAAALRAIVETLGVGSGNVETALAKLTLKGVTSLGMRTVLTGSAVDRLTDFCDSAGLEWSIQDGKVQILDKAKPLEGLSLLLSPQTGLIGSPALDADGKAHAQTLLLPVIPGQIVVIKSEAVSGGFRVEEVEYSGATWESEWTTSIVASKF